MLIVHDSAFARSVDAQLAPLFETARLLDRDALSFRAEAAQRAWLSHYWPSLLG
jgi:hypothetical protein